MFCFSWLYARSQHPADAVEVFLEAEIFSDASGNDLPDVRQRCQLFRCGFLKVLQRSECLCQIPRRLPADIGNAQGKQEGIQLAVLALLQGFRQIQGFFFFKSFQ